MNIHSVASSVAAQTYQQPVSSNSNTLQSIERVAGDVADVAAKVLPVVGLVGGIINTFA
ncbi:hypothetical protein [Paraburkholderia sp.]|uniref:hypothetical protein n=1 Tax=Paraburkholderia sp. TaxID=1926495 RepID=UPI002F40DFDE